MTAPSLPRNSHLASLTLLERQGFTGATVLDIGAAEGAFFLHRHMQKLFLSAKHFFIDAMQENEAVYEKLKRAFGTDHAITALSCVEGEVAVRIDPTFYNTHLVGLQTERYEETRRVRLTKLDSVVAERGLVGPYVLKLDVQGAEVDVLRGSLKTLEQATVVVAEIQIFHERDNLLDLLFFMQSRGFVLFDITDQSYYPSSSTMYQCYATFIPQRMDFRKGLVWCTPEQEIDTNAVLRARRRDTISVLEHLVATLAPGSLIADGGSNGG
jgi:FkbM family methyltransferase